MADTPWTLTAPTHRDASNWWQSPWVRRSLLVIPLLLVALGLANFFGQRPITSVATSPRADLSVYAPVDARSGLIYAARFKITARSELKNATLILDPGWADGYTVNGLSPQPLTEASRDGKLEFGFGHVAAGQHLTFWLSLQVNPTNVGRHHQNVSLYDGSTRLAVIHRSITIFP